MKRHFVLIVSKDNNPYAQLSQSGFADLIGRLKGVSGSTAVYIGDESVFTLHFFHTESDSIGYSVSEFVNTLVKFLGGAEVFIGNNLCRIREDLLKEGCAVPVGRNYIADNKWRVCSLDDDSEFIVSIHHFGIREYDCYGIADCIDFDFYF